MSSQKTALIIGVTGQDGAYLSQLLCERGYRVVGVARRIAPRDLWRLEALGIADKIELQILDMMDYAATLRLLKSLAPDEIYNLGGVSAVSASFMQPLLVSEMIGMGALRLLEAIMNGAAGARYYQASSSEMFGRAESESGKVNEESSAHPVSPYGTAKLYAHWLLVNYREAHSLHASSGILFNHESPLRDISFVSRKITSGLVALANGGQEILTLGNLDNVRDWGYAADYMLAAWLMLQQDVAGDYVIASGATHSVRAMVEAAAREVGFDLIWEGEGAAARGVDKNSGRELVAVDAALYRPTEPDALVGDNNKIKTQLGWKPQIDFAKLVAMMVKSDKELLGAK